MSRIVTIQVEIDNENLSDDRIAHTVWQALDMKRFKCVMVGEAKEPKNTQDTAEEKIRSGIEERKAKAKASDAKHAKASDKGEK